MASRDTVQFAVDTMDSRATVQFAVDTKESTSSYASCHSSAEAPQKSILKSQKSLAAARAEVAELPKLVLPERNAHSCPACIVRATSSGLRRIHSVARAVGSVVRCSRRRSALRRPSTAAKNSAGRGFRMQKSGWCDEKKRSFEDAIENYTPATGANAPKALKNGRRSGAEQVCKKIRDSRTAMKMSIRSRFGEGKANLGNTIGFVAVDVIGAAIVFAAVL